MRVSVIELLLKRYATCSLSHRLAQSVSAPPVCALRVSDIVRFLAARSCRSYVCCDEQCRRATFGLGPGPFAISLRTLRRLLSHDWITKLHRAARIIRDNVSL